MNAAPQRAAAVAALAALGACAARPAALPRELVFESLATWLREGRIEIAVEELARVRDLGDRDFELAQWRSVLAEMQWQDAVAIAEQHLAVRRGRAAQADPALQAKARYRLGELLFTAGRWSEAAMWLADAGRDAGDGAAAFAAIARELPFARKQTGPLLTEQPLLPGGVLEFVCTAADKQRPFAIDTGTSMTTMSSSLADELGVRSRLSAGNGVDSAGRDLPIEIGVLPRFLVGDVVLGDVPVLVVSDAAMALRDIYGGPERVPSGVLGLDAITAFRLTIDPDRVSVVLELPKGLPAIDSVQCVRAGGRCLVPVMVDGVRLWFVLDTGASHSSLTAEGAAALPEGWRSVPSFRRVRTVGGGLVSVREVRDLVLRVSDARFHGVTLPVVAREEHAAFPVHGVLGMDLLARCRVTLDRGRVRVLAFR